MSSLSVLLMLSICSFFSEAQGKITRVVHCHYSTVELTRKMTHLYFTFQELLIPFSFAAVTTVVLRPPSPPQPIVRGTFTISCTAERISDDATVQNFKWYHNQTEITDEVIRERNGRFSIRRVGDVSSTLTVTSTERRDGGEYYCQVFISGSTNPINSLQQNIQIEGIL